MPTSLLLGETKEHAVVTQGHSVCSKERPAKPSHSASNRLSRQPRKFLEKEEGIKAKALSALPYL
jgi:hypothetical protein